MLKLKQEISTDELGEGLDPLFQNLVKMVERMDDNHGINIKQFTKMVVQRKN